MKTVFLGTSDFAARVLERLHAGPHRPALVITRPDRPRGRGRALAAPPVAVAAKELGLALDQPASVNSDEARARIAAARPDTVCVCAYGALIKDPLLSEYPMLNVHPSLLPRWRGAAPIERALDAGDDVTGVCIMRPVADMDAGPVCLRASEPIRGDDDFGTLAARLAELSGDLLVRALDEHPPFEPQPEEGVTLAPKITADDRRLDPGLPADLLERRVRALNPHVGAWVEAGAAGRLGVARARVAADGERPGIGELAADGERLLLGCADGALELLEVKAPGGRSMAAADYLRGRGAPRLGSGASGN